MVAFNCDPNTFDWSAFSSFVDEKLPSYARPVFVRIIEDKNKDVDFERRETGTGRPTKKQRRETERLKDSFVP